MITSAAMLFAAYIIYVYPVSVLNYLLFGGRMFEPALIIPTAAIAAAMLVYKRTHLITSLAPRIAMHFAMGVGLIGFWILSAGLLASILYPWLSIKIGLACLAITAFVTLRAIRNGRLLHVKKLEITSAKIRERVDMAFISDVHLGSNPRQHLERICAEINRLDFDCLIIGGDLFDSSTFDTRDLEPLNGVRKPILYVTGNHEYNVKDPEGKIRSLENHKITMLDDRRIQFGELNVIGVGDDQTLGQQEATMRRLTRDDRFNLVLVHRPSLWDRIPENSDLMLAGHTHNGQIFPFNILIRLQILETGRWLLRGDEHDGGAFPFGWLRLKTVFGLHRKGRSTLYISSGCAPWGPRMRLGTRNEIVHVSIAPSSSAP